MLIRIRILTTIIALASACSVALAVEPIRIDLPSRTTPVDFNREILPLFEANCLACHNQKKTEGGLSLESLPSILRGGDRGPAVVPGKSAESLLLAVAAHQQETIMPPADNVVGAKPLTSSELGLLKLWIDQGAAGKSIAAREVQWQSPSVGYQPALAAAVTPDGELAVCSRGRQLCVYHLATGKLVAHLADPALAGPAKSPGAAPSVAHLDVVRSLAFDPAGELLASGAFREVKLWRRPRVSKAVEWTGDAPLRSLAVSADGQRVATGDEQGRIQLWQTDGGKKLQLLSAHDAAVSGLAFAGPDDALFSCSLDKSLKGWKADGTPLGKANLPEAIESLAAIDEGRQLITGDRRGSVLMWNVASLTAASTEVVKPVAEINAHGGAVTSLAAVADKPQEFFSGGADGLVRRWDASSCNKLAELKNDATVVALAVRADGKRIAAAGAETLKLWDETGKLLATQGDPRMAAKLAKLDAEITFTKSLIGRSQSDLNSYEGLIRIAKVTVDAVKSAEEERKKAEKARDEKKEALEKLKADGDKADKTKVEAAAKALATAETAVAVAGTVIERAKAVAERTAARLAEAQHSLTGQQDLLKKQEAARAEAAAAAKAGGAKFRSLATSPDGRTLAAGCNDGSLHLFDADSGTPSQSLEGHRGIAAALGFSTTGKLFTGSADGSTLVWNTPHEWTLERVIGGQDRPEVLIDRVLSVDFSRDGRTLATGGGVPSRSGEVKLWSVADGKLIREIAGAHSETVFAVRFSPVDERLATAGGDRVVKVFDSNSASELKRFDGHTGHVLSLGWKADGKLLVSSGADNMLKLWDPESGLPVRTMKGGIFGNRTYKGSVTGVTFIGQSEEILAVSGDGTVRLHRAASDHEILTFAGSSAFQHAAAATPDGRSLIATDSEGSLRVWSGQQRPPKWSLAP